MTRHPLFGLGLASFAALVLTPDALFMRLSGMGGYQMVGWRGLMMGAVMVTLWAVIARDRGRDLALLGTGFGLAIVACQYLNATLFSLGIAHAPVAVMLLAVATVPVFAAVFARLIIGEPTRRATWVTILAVLSGITLAVFGGPGGSGADLRRAAGGAGGAGGGDSAGAQLRHPAGAARPAHSLLIGLGAALAGITGVAVTGPAQMTQGTVWAIAITGLVILPVSFFSLSLASRYTHASNVGLLMLLETVLGPLWVWLGVGETPTPMMLAGGVIVVGSLAIYLWHTGRRRMARAA